MDSKGIYDQFPSIYVKKIVQKQKWNFSLRKEKIDTDIPIFFVTSILGLGSMPVFRSLLKASLKKNFL